MMRAAERKGSVPSISFSEDNTSGAFATAIAVLAGRGNVRDQCSNPTWEGVLVQGVETDRRICAEMPRSDHSAPTLREAIDAVGVLSHSEPGRVVSSR